MNKLKFFFIICSLAFIFIACDKNDENPIILDDSEPLALAPNVEWAVVTDPYAAYKTEIGWTSSVSGHCRKGDILLIKGKSLDKNNEKWFYFENGWLPGNCISVYNNRLKAKSVAEQLTKNN